mmetsp:Transcript_50358/g.109700  ORF Transcript_50358/g.109700 Transcript_50358/m.109700 type:complete len:108 (+) Transcript_50358:446-769(+)
METIQGSDEVRVCPHARLFLARPARLELELPWSEDPGKKPPCSISWRFFLVRHCQTRELCSLDSGPHFSISAGPQLHLFQLRIRETSCEVEKTAMRLPMQGLSQFLV